METINIPNDVYNQIFPEHKINNSLVVYDQLGYGIIPFQGKRYQKGYGLGGLFRGLFRAVIPLIKPAIRTFVKPALKTAGKELLKGGVEVISNIATGHNPKEALQNVTSQKLKMLSDEVEKLTKNATVKPRKLSQNKPKKNIPKKKLPKKRKNATKISTTSKKIKKQPRDIFS